MKEEWKPIEGYEGKYQISNMGRVKSAERVKWSGSVYYKAPERILKARKSSNGYLYVSLCKDGKVKHCAIHKLVAQAFLPNPDNLPYINHKDENKENDIVSNLEWCSVSYNNTYNGKAKKVAEKKSKPIFSVDKETGLIMYWESIREAENCTGIRHGDIIRCCQGKRKSAGNHIWFYDDED